MKLTAKWFHKRKCLHKRFSFAITPFNFAIIVLFNPIARNIGVDRRAPGDCRIRESATRMREYTRCCVPALYRLPRIRTIRGTHLILRNRSIIEHRLEDRLASLEALPKV
jgi:hypothetical protein